MTSKVTSKTSQNDFKLHICGWFGFRIENIQFDHPNKVRGQSWPQRSLQKHVKITSNCTFEDCLGLELRIFNLTHQKRSKTQTCLHWYYLIWPTKRGHKQKHVYFKTSNCTFVNGFGLSIFNLTQQSWPLEVTSKTCQNDFKLHIWIVWG